MSLSGQDAPLADREQLRQDINRLRELARMENLSQEELQTALVFRTLIEVRSLDLGGAAPRPAVGGGFGGAEGTLKAIEFTVQAGADTQILSNDVDIDRRVAVLRTVFALDSAATASVFSAVLKSGSETATVDFLEGSTVTPGAIYAWDLPLSSDLSVNYQIDNQETVAILGAWEIDDMGP